VTTFEKIVQKKVIEARKAYERHLADKTSYNGSYLMGRYASLADLLHELEISCAKAKVKKAGR
jgi:hypothetical protein